MRGFLSRGWVQRKYNKGTTRVRQGYNKGSKVNSDGHYETTSKGRETVVMWLMTPN
jgi:SLT domain-containing protein